MKAYVSVRGSFYCVMLPHAGITGDKVVKKLRSEDRANEFCKKLNREIAKHSPAQLPEPTAAEVTVSLPTSHGSVDLAGDPQ